MQKQSKENKTEKTESKKLNYIFVFVCIFTEEIQVVITAAHRQCQIKVLLKWKWQILIAINNTLFIPIRSKFCFFFSFY